MFSLLIALSTLPPDVSPADLARFPVYEAAVLGTEVSRTQMTLCDRRDKESLTLTDCYEWRRLGDSARVTWDVWDELRLAHLKAGSPGQCKYHLQRMRSILGDADYPAGRMPEPIPEWAK